MAEEAKEEIYFPLDDENHPTPIRLNDKQALQQFTVENDDKFAWLKDQAKKGVLSSQVK